MRRLLCATLAAIVLGTGAVASLPAGGSEPGSSGGRAALGAKPLPPLVPPLVLAALQPPRALPAAALRRNARETEPLFEGLTEQRHGSCFREGPSRPCVPVCVQFVGSPRCDRFPSASDGCLRFAGARRRGCLGERGGARPIVVP